MAIVKVQSVMAGPSGPDSGGRTLTLPGVPIVDNVLIAIAGQRAVSFAVTTWPAGWSQVGAHDHSAVVDSKSVEVRAKRVASAADQTLTFTGGGAGGSFPETTILAEFAGFSAGLFDVNATDAGLEFTNDPTAPLGVLATLAGREMLAIAAQWKKAAGPNPGPQAWAGWSALDDSTFQALGNQHRLTTAFIASASAPASVGGQDAAPAAGGTDIGVTVVGAIYPLASIASRYVPRYW